jgi:hypothetical protein
METNEPKRAKSLKERFDDNFALGILAILLTGFLAGIGAYKAIIEIAKLEIVPKQEIADLKQKAEGYDKLNILYIDCQTQNDFVYKSGIEGQTKGEWVKAKKYVSDKHLAWTSSSAGYSATNKEELLLYLKTLYSFKLQYLNKEILNVIVKIEAVKKNTRDPFYNIDMTGEITQEIKDIENTIKREAL